jgi:hypothetical protein
MRVESNHGASTCKPSLTANTNASHPSPSFFIVSCHRDRCTIPSTQIFWRVFRWISGAENKTKENVLIKRVRG